MSQRLLSSVLTGVILLGILIFGFALSVWVLRLLSEYDIAWEIQLAAFGVLLIFFGMIAAKLLSRD